MKLKTRALKKSNPQLAFKLPEEAKKELMDKITFVTDLYNESLKDGQYRFRKNEIIVEALSKGLDELQRRVKK